MLNLHPPEVEENEFPWFEPLAEVTAHGVWWWGEGVPEVHGQSFFCPGERQWLPSFSVICLPPFLLPPTATECPQRQPGAFSCNTDRTDPLLTTIILYLLFQKGWTSSLTDRDLPSLP